MALARRPVVQRQVELTQVQESRGPTRFGGAVEGDPQRRQAARPPRKGTAEADDREWLGHLRTCVIARTDAQTSPSHRRLACVCRSAELVRRGRLKLVQLPGGRTPLRFEAARLPAGESRAGLVCALEE